MPRPSHGMAPAWLATLAVATNPGPSHRAEISEMNQDPMSETCCAVVELRQYTLHPFKRDVLIDLFEQAFVESQEDLGMRLVGSFRDLDDADRFVWLRGFADMPARAQALHDFYTGPVWQTHRAAANATMIDSDDVLLLRPAQIGSAFAVDDEPLAPRDATAIPEGMVEARIYYVGTQPTSAQIESVGLLRPLIELAGGAPEAVLVSEAATNNFPRLPVREDEPALAVFSRFPDEASYRRFLRMSRHSPQWRRAEAALLAEAPRAPDILRLQPTARSRLPR